MGVSVMNRCVGTISDGLVICGVCRVVRGRQRIYQLTLCYKTTRLYRGICASAVLRFDLTGFQQRPLPSLVIYFDLRYVIAPRGGGEDTHRAWEALYLGVVPIVKHSPIDSVFEGLPVHFVDECATFVRFARQLDLTCPCLSVIAT